MSKYKKFDYDSMLDLEEYLEDRIEEWLTEEETQPIFTKSNSQSDEYYNSLLETYVNELEIIINKSASSTTYQVISGSGPAWFINPMSKQFIKTQRGSEVVVIPGKEDEFGRMLVRTMNTFIMVPKEEILDIGFN